MSYPDEHRGHEAFCVQRCSWSQRSATREGALVLAEHHDRNTRLNGAGQVQPVGHRTDVRTVSR